MSSKSSMLTMLNKELPVKFKYLILSAVLMLIPLSVNADEDKFDTILFCKSEKHESDYKWIGLQKLINEWATIVSYSSSGIFLPGSELASVKRTEDKIIFNQDYYRNMNLDRFSLILTTEQKISDYLIFVDYKCSIRDDTENFQRAINEYEAKKDEKLSKRKL